MSASKLKSVSIRGGGVFLAVVGLLAVYAFSFSSADSAVPNPPRSQTLNVLPLRPQDITITDSYVGYVTPIKSVDLVPNVSGYIEYVWVEGGQEVKVGDNLLMIDQREYKAALDAAQAAVTQALANLNNADAHYKRIKKAGAKAISQTEIDNAKAGYLSALAAVEQAKANRAKAQTLYDYTVLQASIDGVVGNVSLTTGNYVAPGTVALLSIIQYNPIRVVFSISDKEYLNALARKNDTLFANENIRLRLANGDLYPLAGEFKFTDNQIDKNTGSIAIYADFANPDHELTANAYVDVLLERTLKGGYLVRQNHVLLTPDGAYVYTVRNQRLTKIPVTIVAEQNGNYVLSNKFASDEYLVIDKVGKTAPDAKLKIKVITAEKS